VSGCDLEKAKVISVSGWAPHRIPSYDIHLKTLSIRLYFYSMAFS